MGELLRDVGKTNKSLKPIYNGKCSLCDGSGKGRGAFLGTKCNHCIGNEPASHCSCRHCELTMFLRPHYNNKEAVQEAVVYTITTERFSDQGTHQPSKEEVLKSLYGTTSHKPAYKKVTDNIFNAPCKDCGGSGVIKHSSHGVNAVHVAVDDVAYSPPASPSSRTAS